MPAIDDQAPHRAAVGVAAEGEAGRELGRRGDGPVELDQRRTGIARATLAGSVDDDRAADDRERRGMVLGRTRGDRERSDRVNTAARDGEADRRAGRRIRRRLVAVEVGLLDGAAERAGSVTGLIVEVRVVRIAGRVDRVREVGRRLHSRRSRERDRGNDDHHRDGPAHGGHRTVKRRKVFSSGCRGVRRPPAHPQGPPAQYGTSGRPLTIGRSRRARHRDDRWRTIGSDLRGVAYVGARGGDHDRLDPLRLRRSPRRTGDGHHLRCGFRPDRRSCTLPWCCSAWPPEARCSA